MQLLATQMLSAALVISVAGLAIPSAGFGQMDTSLRTIRFVISDCWGNSIPSPGIHITEIAAQASRERLSYPQENVTFRKEGQYHILIEAQGFFPASAVIHVLDKDLEVRACLTLAPIEGTTRPRADLKGSVAMGSLHKGKAMWVRLVGLYCDLNVSTSVADNGAFSFGSLQPGRYLILLLEDGRPISQKEVDVRHPSTPVRFP